MYEKTKVLLRCARINVLLLVCLLPSVAYSAAPELLDGGELLSEHVQHLTDTKRNLINSKIQKNKQTMRQSGFASPQGDGMATQPKFVWPVRKAFGVTDFNVDGISNFVDQDRGNSNSLLDYNCGARTYDFPGYDHAGIDIFSWPFSWAKHANSEVEVVSGAAGTIVEKHDGNNDTNFSFTGGEWNAVYVLHNDGSVAWYGHLKKDSLTNNHQTTSSLVVPLGHKCVQINDIHW